jgi:hypothetical protein
MERERRILCTQRIGMWGKSDINVFYSLFSLKPRYQDWFLLTDTCYLCIIATPWEWCICITGHLPFSHRLSVNIMEIKGIKCLFAHRVNSSCVPLTRLYLTRTCVGNQYNIVRGVAQHTRNGHKNVTYYEYFAR